MRRNLYLGGSLLALLGVALLFAEMFRQPAPAQPPPVQPQAVGRFQISSYGYSRSDGATNGAYIVDTQTGEVFQVHGNNPPAIIGSVTKPLPKK